MRDADYSNDSETDSESKSAYDSDQVENDSPEEVDSEDDTLVRRQNPFPVYNPNTKIMGTNIELVCYLQTKKNSNLLSLIGH